MPKPQRSWEIRKRSSWEAIDRECAAPKAKNAAIVSGFAALSLATSATRLAVFALRAEIAPATVATHTTKH